MSILLSVAAFRCRIQKYPSAPNMTTPTPAPTPIPAMAPVDRLESVCAGCVAFAVVDVDVAVAVDVDVDVDEEKARAASTGAMVKEEVPQQSSLSPQHHSVELSVPSQDVSCVVDPAVYTSQSAVSSQQSSHFSTYRSRAADIHTVRLRPLRGRAETAPVRGESDVSAVL